MEGALTALYFWGVRISLANCLTELMIQKKSTIYSTALL